MSALKTLDIVIPCFNPRAGWEKVLTEGVRKVRAGLPEGVLRTVMVVNDGSVNGMTDRIVAQLQAEMPEFRLIAYSENRGKGHAVRTGIGSSIADLQIYTDVDLPYREESVIGFYKLLAANDADVVVASRGDSYYGSLSAFRRILSKTLRSLNGLLFGLKIKDTQGGLKGFNAAGREVFLKTRVNRYLFDLEFIQQASKAGLRMLAVDVELKPGIVLPSPSLVILLKELHNFIRLLIHR